MDYKVPPNFVKDVLAAGYGSYEEFPPAQEGGPHASHFILTVKEMEAMGEADRKRLGVEAYYQFALQHRPQQ